MDARAVALKLLDRVTAEGRTLAEVTPDLPPAEAARAMRLATSTLRQMGRCDRLLGQQLKKRPPETVLNLLRLAVTELAEGGAPHGVVHSAVQLAHASKSTAPFAGLINAVLRRVAVPAGWQGMAPPELPKALRKPLVAAWGKEAVAAIEAVQAQVPPLDLTPRDGDADALAGEVGGEALPTGSVRLTGSRQVSALPGYSEGRFWVQDAAAALPARLLAARPGERVLDLCAAPGGKTLQLAAAGAAVTAVDISAERLERLRANLARTGLRAEVVAADALAWGAVPGREGDPSPPPSPPRGEGAAAAGARPPWNGEPFDAVLLDAPCSATGTIRRHPDLPRARRSVDLAPLVELQARLLARAAGLVRPGGRLVFATCSLFPEEGEAHLAAAAALGLEPDPAAVEALALAPGWRCGASGLRLRPDIWAERGGIDGFFMAAFRRPG
jgi:16S rRNA (cytosine967-C5)-methyltransferase